MISKTLLIFALSVSSTPYVVGVSVVSGGVEYIGAVVPQLPVQEQFLGHSRSFYRIPFASAGRFERPQRPTITSPFNATAFGPLCPQLQPTDSFTQSEDCLSVNVWRPTGTTAQSELPVMVWIYGGSYTHGAAAEYPMYAHGAVAQNKTKPIIGVNFNYRTGVYGFPIGEEAKKNNALNLALYDQRAALEWVQEHIADFGGDKSRVTLFGQSAGAVSVGLQLLYNGGNIGGAFHHAIMESGSPNSFAASPASTPAREVAYSFLLNSTGCVASANTFACLKSAPYEEFNAAHIASYDYMRDYVVDDYGWSAYSPVVSPPDDFLPIRPYLAIKTGAFAQIPMISGNVLDEGTAFVPVPETRDDIVAFLTTSVPGSDFGLSEPEDVGAITNLVNNVYPDDPAEGSPYGTGNEIFNTSQYWKQATSITGDIVFEAPRRFFIQEAVNRGLNVWSYRWLQHNGLLGFVPRVGIAHSSEIYAQFCNSDISPEAFSVGGVFTDFFSSFAYTGSASTTPDTSLPVWEKYSEGIQSFQFKYNDYKMVKDDYRKDNMDTIISTLLSNN